MARAALTAATVLSMSSPALAHPSFEDYMDHHGAELSYSPGDPMLQHPVWQLDARAREDWRRIDAKYERRQRRLEREREAQAAESDSNNVLYASSIDWLAISTCESGGDVNAYNPAGPYYGILQFDQDTWTGYGGEDSPMGKSLAETVVIAERVAAGQGGANAWPVCWWAQ